MRSHTSPSFKVKQSSASKNRPKGTPELKSVLSVKKETIRKMFLENVLPVISRKWPQNKRRREVPGVVVQLDDAGPHLSPTDKALLEESRIYTNVKISFKCQPAMSPDLSVLDLCFFNSLQTSQLCKLATTFEELRDNVLAAFREYETAKLSNIWKTLQLIYNEVIKHKGANEYILPHINKKKLRKEGRLPENVDIDLTAYKVLIEHSNYLNKQKTKNKEDNEILQQVMNTVEI